MSRVIKASHLVINEESKINITGIIPRVIEKEIDANEDKQESEDQTTDDVLSPEEARVESDKILKETELMVEQLINNARSKAKTIIEDAKRESQRLIHEAEQRLEEATKEGFDSGYQEGLVSGKQQGLKECEALKQETQQILEHAQVQKQDIIASAEPEILELSLAVAKKVVVQELEISPEIVKSIVQNALKKVSDREEVIIKVNSIDLDNVLTMEEHILRQLQGVKTLKIIADDLIEPGGCVIDTPCGSVDGRIDSQLERIKEAIMGVM